jgi:glycosyltransferase involved in cell wall biosynthesis
MTISEPDGIGGDRPRLTVVMPAFQAARTVGAAIDSVLRQSVRAVEIIVVDDGSTDATAQEVRRCATVDPRVRLLEQANAGPSAARNRGIGAARGELVAFLDADDLMLPSYAARMLERFTARPDVDLVSCDAWVLDDRRGRIRRRTVLDEAPPPRDLAPDPDGMFVQLARGNFVYVGCTVRGSALQALGGFDESTNACEDWNLWLRLLASGRRLEVLREPLGVYRLSEGQAHRDHVRMERGRASLDAWIRSTGRVPDLRRAPTASARGSAAVRAVVRAAAPGPVVAFLACRRRPPTAVAAAFPSLTH